MGQALVTAVGIGFLGTLLTTFFGLTAADGDAIRRHVTFGIFSTMVTLLGHSMMMFYLIGKGKAVKDAMKENGHEETGDDFRRFVGRRRHFARER